MVVKIKTFFFKFWWLYYFLCFLLIGWIIYLLFQGLNYNNYSNSIVDFQDRIENCDCGNEDIIPIENEEDLSDSIRVIDNEGEFGCLSYTLIWNSTDDLDLHVIDVNENHIFFKHYCKGNDNEFTNTGGQLDIDLNAGEERTNNPVENVYFKCTPPKGSYRIYVNAYDKKDNEPLAFNIIVRENGVVKKQIESTISQKKENKFVLDYLYH
jgi:hypothetical protein